MGSRIGSRVKELLAPRSFRHRLMAASVVCILVPAFITLIVYNSLTEEAVKRQAVANAEDSLQLVNGSVTNVLKGMLNVANYIQVNSDMNAYFKLLTSGNDDGSDPYEKFMARNRVLQQLDSLTVLGEKFFVTVLLSNGEFFTSYSADDYRPLSWKNHEWFGRLESLRGFQSYWSPAEPTAFGLEKLDHPYQLSVGRTLRKENSEIYGYIIVTTMEDQISSIFGRLTAGQEVMLLDGDGRIVSDRDPSKIGEAYPYPEGSEEAGSYSIVKRDGARWLLARQPLPFNDWSLVSVQPYKEAIVNISSIFNRVFLFQIASFVAFLLLLLVLLREFTKPLARLGRTTSAVQRGNLSIRSGIRGQDEIGRLGFLFDQMLDRVQEMIAEVSETQARKRKAELKMLQAQIHPHFLFNVLNSIRMKVMRRGDPESAKMIASLSKLLRMTISKEEDAIFLHEELDLLASYAELMNLRQKEEVRLELDVASEAFLVKVPRFFLQPLVENALVHGLKQRAGTIRVSAELDRLFLKMTVEDDGAGMEPDRLAALNARLNAAGPPSPNGRGGAGAEEEEDGTESEAEGSTERGSAGRTAGGADRGAEGGRERRTDRGVNGGMERRADRGVNGGMERRADRGAEGSADGGARGGSFSGIGLLNVVERMRMVFGDGFRMSVESEPERGSTIRLYIPRKEGARDV
ncbi:hypothetical protein J19TS2_00890 [Cohnella xylanilytica]|uniref:cache domain-containing sensor histidine kinase n=1 Tax=Cohnella xylanilytica TaxID=557555 RepID=UPI001B2AA698|nr:histidine kinase [Cohnella xylanilytica]GIO10534.1 hypothetical protein J19TS2_00890 [Cohnella xylanilytica]